VPAQPRSILKHHRARTAWSPSPEWKKHLAPAFLTALTTVQQTTTATHPGTADPPVGPERSSIFEDRDPVLGPPDETFRSREDLRTECGPTFPDLNSALNATLADVLDCLEPDSTTPTEATQTLQVSSSLPHTTSPSSPQSRTDHDTPQCDTSVVSRHIHTPTRSVLALDVTVDDRSKRPLWARVIINDV